MLALPAKTLAAGFLPSSGALFLCWVYMAASGLLIAEVNVNTLYTPHRSTPLHRRAAAHRRAGRAAAPPLHTTHRCTLCPSRTPRSLHPLCRCSLERDAVSITSMAAETIGEAGARLCGVAYVFIHYSLLVAYFLQGGALTLTPTLTPTLTLTPTPTLNPNPDP